MKVVAGGYLAEVARYRRARSTAEKRHRQLLGLIVGVPAALVMIGGLALWDLLADDGLPRWSAYPAVLAVVALALAAEWRVGSRPGPHR